MADDTSKVPKLKGKKYADYAISEEEWKMVELVHEVLKVMLFFPSVVYLYDCRNHVMPKHLFLQSLCQLCGILYQL